MPKMIRALLAVLNCSLLVVAAAGASEIHRYNWEGMEVIALADVDSKGEAPNKPELLLGLTEAEKAALPAGIMKNSINCFVVKLPGKTVLFDTGLGGDHGRLLQSMAEAGLEPDDIAAILITHFHPDHIGGLVKDGKMVFAGAEIHVPRVEAETMKREAERFIPVYAERVRMFDWDQPVIDGVVARKATGHTPGHTVFEITAGESSLLVLGDLIHFAGVQLPRPEVAVIYDTDPEEAIRSRKAIFDLASDRGITVAAMHLPFPGVGVLKHAGDGYAFEGAE